MGFRIRARRSSLEERSFNRQTASFSLPRFVNDMSQCNATSRVRRSGTFCSQCKESTQRGHAIGIISACRFVYDRLLRKQTSSGKRVQRHQLTCALT